MLPRTHVETADKQVASGIVEIDGADVVALFRRDGGSRKPALVQHSPIEEIRMGMDRAANGPRRHRRGGRDHIAQESTTMRTRLGFVRRKRFRQWREVTMPSQALAWAGGAASTTGTPSQALSHGACTITACRSARANWCAT